MTASISAAAGFQAWHHEVPCKADRVLSQEVAGELVLLDGWTAAWVLNPSALAIWQRIDGKATWREIAIALSVDYATDLSVVLADVVAMAKHFAGVGLLAGSSVPDAGLDVAFEPVPPLDARSLVGAVVGRDLNGTAQRLDDLRETDLLVINWNPHCGYCAGVGAALADLDSALSAAGVKILLVASGSPSANRELLDVLDWHPLAIVVEDNSDPFRGAGTPSAYHLGPERDVLTSAAHGGGDIVELAERLAGIEREAKALAHGPTEIRYLLERDAVCAPGAGTTPGVTWTETCVYRLGEYHVGVRVDSGFTADALDLLFSQTRLTDPRAGHSFSLSLSPVSERDGSSRARGLSLLIQPGRTPTRSRDPARILRALLFELHDRITGRDAQTGCIRVNAIAVQRRDGGVGLIPADFYAFAPRLQPLLAQRGLALIDSRWPEIDLSSREVVVPAPQVPFDPRALDEFGNPPAGDAELAAVLPGRYPLIGWCSIHPGDHEIVGLSAAEAAAANLSFVFHCGDPVQRLAELGELFRDLPAFGLWYGSEGHLVDLIASALDRDSVGPPARVPQGAGSSRGSGA